MQRVGCTGVGGRQPIGRRPSGLLRHDATCARRTALKSAHGGRSRWGNCQSSPAVCTTGKGKAALPKRSTITEKSQQADKQQGVEPNGQPSAPGDPNAIAGLTPREREVLLLLSRAASNREIGRTLGIAERTVKAHLTNIMTKIDVSSRTEAALFAFAHHCDIHRGEPCPPD
ncbi:response regulator transcription factor [Streptomyces sp. NPDC040750]|uniref:response regulator transcription factor n=1 Tax=Streptomyces sp. NPDC040750 TaxID=3154491 RepID=UPI0033D6363D